MERITLSWNSRTPEGIIAKDENFKNILEFIKKGKRNKWIINFYGYDNEESLAFREKMINIVINMLKKEINDKNFFLKKAEICLFARESQSSPDELLQELKKIPKQQSGIVALYEPIDYEYKISAHKDRKYEVHKKIADIFKENNLFLLLFGNIPYDIHYIVENSPISQFVWREYEIKEYRKNELDVLDTLKSHVREAIIEDSKGNFEVVSDLENFWKEKKIEMEEQVKNLVKQFLEGPHRSRIEKIVQRKLVDLSRFLENNEDIVQDKIRYVGNEKIHIVKEKGSELFKAYFDKSALFDSKKITDQFKHYYELKPKPVFAPIVNESGFIRNNGNIEPLPLISETFDENFDQIAACFETKSPIFILGAGDSMASGAPDREIFFKEILIQIHPSKREEYKTTDYQKLKKDFQKLIDRHTRDDIRKRAIKLLSDLKPSIGYYYLTQLAKLKKNNVKTFITTNFDTLLEDSLMDYGIRSRDFLKLVSKENIDEHEWDWVNGFPDHLKIFKICGDMYYGSWLAVDDDAANTWIEKTVKTLINVIEIRDSTFFIILGHRYGEIDLNRIFGESQRENMFIVYANPSENDCREFEDKYKHKGIIKAISGDFGKFDNFTHELYQRLRKRNLV